MHIRKTRKSPKKIAALLAAAAALLVLFGCANADRMAAKPPQSPLSGLTDDEKELAVRVTRLIEENFSAVTDAYVVLTGATAIIGLDLNERLSDADQIALKRRIEELVTEQEAGIEKAVVTVTPELVDRIMDMLGDDSDMNTPHPRDDERLYRLRPVI